MWSCDLASKLNDVTDTGDELDIDVSIALFQNQTICRVVCVAILHICPHTDLVTVFSN